jgi:hypothetical protein
MQSDPHSFDAIKPPFIFVPHGAPEPTEWHESHRDGIKLPTPPVPRAVLGRSPRLRSRRREAMLARARQHCHRAREIVEGSCDS